MPRRLPVSLLAAFALIVSAGVLSQSAAAEPSWTTYHRDALRSGDDPEVGEAITPTLAWHSQDLGAPIWSQPLVLGSRVYVATVGDKLFALEASSGAIVWETSVGTPVPSSALPCGDITPTVGIVGTPVIDPATGVLYAVADTWDGSNAHHELVAVSLTSGQILRRTAVDPPGADSKAILQRTALNLDDGNVIFGFGGNDGDCSDYVGAVVSAPESGAAASYWQVPISAPSSSGGAIWATSGPAVGPEGDIYATTGNPVPPSGQSPGAYDYSDSVVQLSSSLAPIGSFEPPNWLQEGEDDLDLSSAGAELLPGGLLFQAGKDGKGYLIDEATMAGKPGAAAVFEGTVCGGRGSFGGDAFAGGVIYVPCTNGVQALAYNQATRSFSPLWQGPADAFGAPIVSGGLVWDIASGGFSGGGMTLYALDPATGQPRYTETLPSAVADHFASPSAAGGRVFLATGSSETAYAIAPPTTTTTTTTITNTTTTTPGGIVPILSRGSNPSVSPAPAPALLHAHLLAGRKGRVKIALRCALTTGRCQGTVTLRAKFVRTRRIHRHSVHSTTYITLGHVGFDHGKGSFVLTLRLSRKSRALLRKHHERLALQLDVAAAGAPPRKLAATLSGR